MELALSTWKLMYQWADTWTLPHNCQLTAADKHYYYSADAQRLFCNNIF